MKSKKLKKILIVGLGPMGRSHFLSFYKKNYLIELCDKKTSILPLKKYQNDNKIRFLKSIPKNQTYDLVIVSTNSKERLSIIKDLLKKNQIKYLLLEKFIFPKIEDFYIFSKLVKKYNVKNIRVNTWGSFLVDNLNMKKLINKNVNIVCKLVKGSLGTNILHILDLFCALTKKKEIFFLEKPVKIIKSKRKGYHEIDAELVVYNKNGVIKISADSNKKYHILDIQNNNDNYYIHVNKSLMCTLYKNQTKRKSINFPFAKNFTEPFFKKCIKKKENFKNYDIISKISTEVLNFVNNKTKRNILLT